MVPVVQGDDVGVGSIAVARAPAATHCAAAAEHAEEIDTVANLVGIVCHGVGLEPVFNGAAARRQEVDILHAGESVFHLQHIVVGSSSFDGEGNEIGLVRNDGLGAVVIDCGYAIGLVVGEGRRHLGTVCVCVAGYGVYHLIGVIDVIFLDGERRAGGSLPCEGAVCYLKVDGGVDLLARHDHRHAHKCAGTGNLGIFYPERELNARLVKLVVDDCGTVEFTCSLKVLSNSSLCEDAEEILDGLAAVELLGEVAEVVAKLHGLIVVAVDPLAEHRHLGGVPLQAGVVVAGVLEVVKADGILIGVGGSVLGGACAEQQGRAAGVGNLDLEHADRLIVLADEVASHRPGACAGYGLHTAGVGAVDESIVLPSVAPGVGDNPGSYLVLVLLTIDAIAVEVKLNAVIVAHDGLGMVVGGAPVGHIYFADYTESLVGRGVGDVACNIVGGSHTKPSHATGVEVKIAVVVPEPLLQDFAAFFRHHALLNRVGDPVAVVSCAIPLVVALHPAVVVVRAVLNAEVLGVGLATVVSLGGIAHVEQKLVPAGALILVGIEEVEVGSEAVRGILGV